MSLKKRIAENAWTIVGVAALYATVILLVIVYYSIHGTLPSLPMHGAW